MMLEEVVGQNDFLLLDNCSLRFPKSLLLDYLTKRPRNLDPYREMMRQDQDWINHIIKITKTKEGRKLFITEEVKGEYLSMLNHIKYVTSDIKRERQRNGKRDKDSFETLEHLISSKEELLKIFDQRVIPSRKISLPFQNSKVSHVDAAMAILVVGYAIFHPEKRAGVITGDIGLARYYTQILKRLPLESASCLVENTHIYLSFPEGIQMWQHQNRQSARYQTVKIS